MFVPQAIKDRVTAILKEGIAKAEAHYNVKVRMPTVIYTKGGSVAGTASYVRWEINLNPVLLMENIEDFLARTVLHELGHLVNDLVNPEDHHDRGFRMTRRGMRRGKRDVHGAGWQSVMVVLGGPTERCHSYDTTNSSRKKARYEYKCGCGKTIELGPKHHALEQRKPGTVHHKTCRGLKLTYMSAAAKLQPVPTTPAVREPAIKVVLPAGYGKTFTPPTVPTGMMTLNPMKPIAPPAPKTGSKLDQCYHWYKHYSARGDKQLTLSVFMNEVGMTPAGASTYYYKCKAMDEANV